MELVSLDMQFFKEQLSRSPADYYIKKCYLINCILETRKCKHSYLPLYCQNNTCFFYSLDNVSKSVI